ncbi:hypothetical protein ABPG74_019729 [Tetrahymena malaccensis]
MGQHQAKVSLQRKYSFGSIEQDPKISQENEIIEKQLKERKPISDEADISKIQLSLYKKDFYLLKLNYQLNYFNNVYLSDVEGVSLSLLQIIGLQGTNNFFNIIEFLSKLKEIKRMQIDILDIQEPYLSHFINSIIQIKTLQELTLSSIDDSSVNQSHFQQIIQWISEQLSMKKLTLSLKFKMHINHQFYSQFENLFFMEKLRLEFTEYCIISSEGLIELGKAISKYFRLTLLTIQIISKESHIDSNSIRHFAQNFQQLQALEQFSFSIKQQIFKEDDIDSIYSILNYTLNIKSFQIYIETLEMSSQCQQYWRNESSQPSLLKKIETLKYLIINIELNNTNSYCINSLSRILLQLSNLETLEINIGQNGNIQEQDYIQLFESIQNLSNLRDLQISLSKDNNFSQKSAFNFSICLGFLQKLKRFSFSVDESIKVDNISVQCIYEGLQKLKKLKQLFIQVNNPYQIIFIGLLQLLNKLDEDGVQFCYVEKILFERQIQRNSISKLNLHLSKFSEIGILGLSQGLSQLNQLEYFHLKIQESHINSQQYKILGESLIGMRQLICLSLDFDENDTNIIIDFGICLQYLQNLRFLVLALNQIEGVQIYLPKIKSLNKLSLQLKIEEKNQQAFLINLNQLNNILSSQNNLIYFNFEIQCSSNIKLYQDNLQILTGSLKSILQLNHFRLVVKEKQVLQDSLFSLSDYLIKNLCSYSIYLKQLQILTLSIQEQNFLQEQSLLLLSEALPNFANLNQLHLHIDKSKYKLHTSTFSQLFKSFNNLNQLKILSIFIFNLQQIPIPEVEKELTPSLVQSLAQKHISILTLNQELTMIRKNRYKIIKKLSTLFYLQSCKPQSYY